MLVPTSGITTDYLIEHLEILGPTEGRSTRIRMLGWITLGPPKSLLEAERHALDAVEATLLVDRVRYTGRDDVMLAELAAGSVIAGTFTRSGTRSAPVLWCQERIAALAGKKPAGKLAIVVNSGNANAFTGRLGDGRDHGVSRSDPEQDEDDDGDQPERQAGQGKAPCYVAGHFCASPPARPTRGAVPGRGSDHRGRSSALVPTQASGERSS